MRALNSAPLAIFVLLAACSSPPHGPVPQAELLAAIGSGVPPVIVDHSAAGQALFDRMCVACHTVGAGPRIGPDLAGVTSRRDDVWLRKWLKDPIGMTQSDPIAKELLGKWKNVQMPPQPISAAELDDLLAYLAAPPKVASDAPSGIFKCSHMRSASTLLDRPAKISSSPFAP